MALGEWTWGGGRLSSVGPCPWLRHVHQAGPATPQRGIRAAVVAELTSASDCDSGHSLLLLVAVSAIDFVPGPACPCLWWFSLQSLAVVLSGSHGAGRGTRGP